MRKERVLAEARAYQLEHYVCHELDDMVDYRTGEILDARRYHRHPWDPSSSPAQAAFSDLTSRHQRDTFLDAIDKRTLSLHNACLALYDRDKGAYHLSGAPIRLTTSAYRKLDQLVRLLDYRNLIITDPETLARRLALRPNHLHRHLKGLAPLVRVWGARDGMAKGTIKIAVSPAYGFRYPKEQQTTARHTAVAEWYRAMMQQRNTHTEGVTTCSASPDSSTS